MRTKKNAPAGSVGRATRALQSSCLGCIIRYLPILALAATGEGVANKTDVDVGNAGVSPALVHDSAGVL